MRIDPLILVVEDKPEFVHFITVNLEISGYQVKSTDNADDAIALAKRDKPDLILLDIMLRGSKDGFDTCREIRQFSPVPIIMLTALGQTEHIVRGLDAGADDYVPKPFSAQELMARVRARFRRTPSDYATLNPEEEVFEAGGLKVDFGQQRVYVNGEEKALPPLQYRLLINLVHNEGRVIPTMNLLERVWDIDETEPQVLWQAIHRLRHKIEPNPHKPRYIHTRSGIGYVFIVEVDEEEES